MCVRCIQFQKLLVKNDHLLHILKLFFVSIDNEKNLIISHFGRSDLYTLKEDEGEPITYAADYFVNNQVKSTTLHSTFIFNAAK